MSSLAWSQSGVVRTRNADIYKVAPLVYDDIKKFEPDWWADAVCVTKDIGVFFGSEGAHTSLTEAREHCGVCPVSKTCLTHALKTPEEYGIWAGTSARNRESMLSDINNGDYAMDEIIDTVINGSFRWRRKK